MSDLLDLAISAHGGWDRWSSITKLTAEITLGGAIWRLKSQTGALNDIRVDLSVHEQHLEIRPFGQLGHHSVYQPDRTTIISDSGEVLDWRDHPRDAFAGHRRDTPWDDHHLIYFRGYALWTYLTTPFLFRLPGFQTEEIEPWENGDIIWRRLKVTFPAYVPTHSPQQIFYFDETGLLCREDYSVEIMGGTDSANYATDPQVFDGLIVPTKRRIFDRQPDNRPNTDHVIVAIDIHRLVVS